MSLADTVRATEEYLARETAAQEHLLALLHELEAAVRKSVTADVLATNTRYREALATTGQRDAQRLKLLNAFATFYGVDPRTLTLSSIVARLGDHGRGLDQRRLELRKATSRVLQASRRLASLARYHRGVVEEVLGLMQPDDARDSDGRGSLVHVEA